MREGAADLVQLRARAFLGQVPPGQGTPTFPGWTTWAGLFLAGFLSLAHSIAGGSVPLAEFLQRTGPLQTTLLRISASLLASGCLLIAAGVLVRMLPERGGDRPSDPPGRFARARLGALVLAVTLLLAPLLADGVARVSPALLGSLLWLQLTGTLLEDIEPGDLRWGAVSGIWLGVLLGACGWLWSTVPVFLVVALLQRRGGGAVLAALATALGIGLALDPVRLLDPASFGPRLLTEWSRAGGWNLASVPLGSQGLVAMVTLHPLVGWGAIVGVVAMFVLWIHGRRIDALIWWGGLGLIAVVLPAVSGIRGLDLLQQTWAPVFALAAAGAVGHLAVRSGIGRILSAILASALVLGAGLARIESERTPAALPLVEIVAQIEALVPEEALLVAERTVPGLEATRHVYALPRDSRRPERFDFAYWPRWYSGFDFVLLSEIQVGQNAGRTNPLHFYGQLRDKGEPVARWGRKGSGWILYRVRDEGPWRTGPTQAELSALTPTPELLQFIDQLGAFYAQSGRPGLARTLFQAGLEFDPSRDSLYNNLGSVYLLESEWEEAARTFEEGLRRNPNSAVLCYNAGRAFFELGTFPRAEALFRRAVGLRPDFADAHYELARTFLALKQTDLARMALQRVLTLGPAPERRAAVEAVLAQLPAGQTPGATGSSGTGGPR